MPADATERVQEALRHARKFLEEAAPEVLNLTEVAERVGQVIGVNTTSTRRYIRQSVESGELVELRPDRGWYVVLPGAREARLPRVRLIKEHMSVPAEEGRFRTVVRHVLSADEKQYVGTPYGPGNTSYVITAAQAQAFVEKTVAEVAAKEQAERDAREAEKNAERKEIRRRHKGLLRLAHRMTLFLDAQGGGDHGGGAHVHLHMPYDKRKKEAPLSEAVLHFDVDSRGDMVPVLMDILARGVESLVAGQPEVVCRHCGGRIMHFQRGLEDFWWHWDSTSSTCGHSDTVATPSKKTS